MSNYSHVIFHQKSWKLIHLNGLITALFTDESLQIGNSEDLLLCNSSVLPMMAGTQALPKKGSASCKVLEMLGMGRDRERQGASQRSHDLRVMQKVNFSGWTRGGSRVCGLGKIVRVRVRVALTHPGGVSLGQCSPGRVCSKQQWRGSVRCREGERLAQAA